MKLKDLIGLCAILGENSGEKWDTCALALAASMSRADVHGQFLASSHRRRKTIRSIAMREATTATESQLQCERSLRIFWGCHLKCEIRILHYTTCGASNKQFCERS